MSDSRTGLSLSKQKKKKRRKNQSSMQIAEKYALFDEESSDSSDPEPILKRQGREAVASPSFMGANSQAIKRYEDAQKALADASRSPVRKRDRNIFAESSQRDKSNSSYRSRRLTGLRSHRLNSPKSSHLEERSQKR